MTDFAIANSHGGRPLTPDELLIGSIIVGAAGLFAIVKGLRKGQSATNGWRWGDRPQHAPVSRAGHFLVGISFLLLSAFMSDGFRHWLSPSAHICLPLASIGMMIFAAIFDGLRQWRREGYPILTRCPECGKRLDFRMGRHRCKVDRGFEVLHGKK